MNISLADTIHTVRGRFNCYYLICNDTNIIVVDIGFASEADLILKYVQQSLGRNSEEIRLIVVTHYHFDHVNGIDRLVDKTGAEVASHINAEMLFKGQSAQPMLKMSELIGTIYFWLKSGCPRPSFRDLLSPPLSGFWGVRKGIRSKVTYLLQDNQPLPYAPDWIVIHTPGHTDDSICLYNSQFRALIAGDTIINPNGIPQLNTIIMHDPIATKESLAKLKRLKIDHVYPGWGYPISGESIIDNIVS